MKKLLFALLLIPFPALAADCTLVSCTCVGMIYKDTSLGPAAGWATRSFDWSKAERRFNNQLTDRVVAGVLISYESQGTHVCCEYIDNNNTSSPWEALSVTYLPADNGDLKQLIVGFYADTPAAGDRWYFTTGDATTERVVSANNPTSSGIEITSLMGGSAPRDLATGQNLITNARTDHKPGLQSDIFADGC